MLVHDEAPAGAFGPILVLCMTNHALDSFLEELLGPQVEGAQPRYDVVRVGARSRNPRFEELNLKRRIDDAARRAYGRNFHQVEGEFGIAGLVRRLSERVDWDDVEQDVRRLAPGLADLLDDVNAGVPLDDGDDDDVEDEVDEGVGDDGARDNEWRVVSHRREPSKKRLVGWARRGREAAERRPQLTLQELVRATPAQFDGLSRSEREAVVETIRREALRRACATLETARRAMAMDNAAGAVRALRRAQIVGMTTSKATEMRDVIQELEPRVVMCEEAAEILEAHLLASLSAATEHVILVGDHQQLRPKVQTYELRREAGRGLDLDVSTFERMVEEATYPFATLTTQRRMRPEISVFVREALYPALQDHPSTVGREHVRGVTSDVVFMQHRNVEDGWRGGGAAGDTGESRSTSRSNAFEADFVARFAVYLLQQGYALRPDAAPDAEPRIAILTPYLAQLGLIRRALERRRHDMVVELGEADQEELATAEDGRRHGHVHGIEALPQPTSESGVRVHRSSALRRVRIATVCVSSPSHERSTD